MKMSRLFLSLVLLTAPLFAFAQDAAADARFADLRASMTPEEFKAAGLDKLSDAELSALSTWLNRKVGTETARAVEQVRQETQTAVAQAQADTRKRVEQENRGFFDFGSDEPIKSTLVGEFKGFAEGNRYTLANGQVWEQIEPASLPGVRKTNPDVVVKPGLFNNWFLRIGGYNTAAKVRRIK
ncbi:hypothetical protein SAMN05428982_1033 [Pseudoxanthomonas sp. CF385]|uniref:hypothetical protein n=1 Tax=Pseudoxanthomonas sp. CF385 TaxID=1881042 RepID=UPI0008859059|nr:hypothetical protein [Pseudoxanthomonas sp. CF385]SDQ41623.1 hypothetical protein SAMN05428982_1033 [Pseudoxanthomonas sp. CF385]